MTVLAGVSSRIDRPRHRERHTPRILLTISIVVAAVMALPLVFLFIFADHAGAAAARPSCHRA